VIAGHDLSGREVIVTGGTSGIGLATARALAGAGARVLLTGRDAEKGAAAAARLRAVSARVEFEPLELGRLASIEEFVRRFLATGRPLHLLINNAGIMAGPLSYTEDGFESHFGANHLGHFALTVGLLPALAAACSARVLTVSSRAHRRSAVDFDDPNYRGRRYEAMQAYGQSKTANSLFAVGISNRHAADGITANTVMPGLTMTGLARDLPPAQLVALGWVNEAGNPEGTARAADWRSVEQAAATIVWGAAAPELAGVGGLCLENCAVARPWTSPGDMPLGHYLPYALDPDHAERLWSLSDSLVRR
jgi:NAD(P)-dependent dehydrogenase (short-subunit alcohol dehydrogenase family)